MNAREQWRPYIAVDVTVLRYWWMMVNGGEQGLGGWGEIRTHGTLAGTPVFKTGALNHSATHPCLEKQAFAPEQTEGANANCHPIATRRDGECYHDAPRLAKAALIAWAALSSDCRNRCA